MEIVGNIFFIGYMIALVYVTLFCLLQIHLLIKYWGGGLSNRVKDDFIDLRDDKLPIVTVQLPIFNEKYVVERLINTITKLEYPKEKLQIQILDDSTDETVEISEFLATKYRKEGFDIEVLKRTIRTGFKAGALKEAMPYVKGEFIAIFDADFLPDPDFLRKALPAFAEEKVGVVQTRWGHINQKYSLLTEMQAFQLNVHFTIEQKGREIANYPLQFNGTAGIWRKVTIEEAGGWEADTLTEDLDLSYRAQLKGWKIKFLIDVVSPAELPSEIYGLKSQQYRWMKGGAETAKKLIPRVWASDLPLYQRMQGVLHLMSSTVFIFVFLLGVFSIPVLLYMLYYPVDMAYFGVFLVGLVSLLFVYYTANVIVAWKDGSLVKRTVKFILIFPIFLALSMGLSFHNALAVAQGYLGRTTAFIRTPKYGIQSMTDSWRKAIYKESKLSGVTLFEGLFSLVFLSTAIVGIWMNQYSFVIFHLLLAVGYGTSFFYAVKHLR